MKNLDKELILLFALCMIVAGIVLLDEYHRGFNAGHESGFNDGAQQVADDVTSVLTENQYNEIPRRSLFYMDIPLLK
jgi:hypothetical protein